MFKKLALATFVLFSLMTSYAQTGTWSGKIDLQGTNLSIVFHLDDNNPTIDSPDQGVKGIPAQVERFGAGKIVVKMPSLVASYEGQWLINKIVGTFRQGSMSLPLTLSPGEDKPARPQTPKAPYPYSTEEVSFVNGDVVLNGTLTTPQVCSRKTPVLIMVTGSGQQNRDEEIFEHKPFAVIADAFAREGIATLRYDDRGFGGYSGDVNNCTVDDFKNDALAGVRFLRERFDNVGVIGHSEGGTIAIMLAAEEQVDFVVSLAGMIVSGADALVAQNRIALTSAGMPEEIVQEYCRLIDKAFDAKVNGDIMPRVDEYDLPDALKQNFMAVPNQLQVPYMQHFLSLDVRPMLGKIKCPVMALNGTKDIQVECETNLEALRNGLTASQNGVVESVEGVNHLFQHCTTGNTSEYRDIEETFAPEILEKMMLWIRGI